MEGGPVGNSGLLDPNVAGGVASPMEGNDDEELDSRTHQQTHYVDSVDETDLDSSVRENLSFSGGGNPVRHSGGGNPVRHSGGGTPVRHSGGGKPLRQEKISIVADFWDRNPLSGAKHFLVKFVEKHFGSCSRIYDYLRPWRFHLSVLLAIICIVFFVTQVADIVNPNLRKNLGFGDDVDIFYENQWCPSSVKDATDEYIVVESTDPDNPFEIKIPRDSSFPNLRAPLARQVDELRDVVLNNREQIDNLKSDTKHKVENFNTIFKNLQIEVKKNNTENDAERKKIINQQSSMSNDLTNITEKQEIIDGNLNDLFASFENLEKDILNIQKEVKEVQKVVKEVQIDVKQVQKDVTEVQKGVHGVNEDIKEVKKDVKNIKEDLGGVKGDIVDLTADQSETKKEIEKLTKQVDDLQKKLSQPAASDSIDINQIDTKLETLRNELKQDFNNGYADLQNWVKISVVDFLDKNTIESLLQKQKEVIDQEIKSSNYATSKDVKENSDVTLSKTQNDLEKMKKEIIKTISNRLDERLKEEQKERKSLDERLKKERKMEKQERKVEKREEEKTRKQKIQEKTGEEDKKTCDSNELKKEIMTLVRAEIDDRITYHIDADSTGEPDWLQFVIDSSDPYTTPLSMIDRWRLFGDTMRITSIVLEKTNKPGDCWGMDGSQGYLTFKLYQPQKLTHIRLSHVGKQIAFDLTSMPKDYKIHVSEKGENWMEVGSCTHRQDIDVVDQICDLDTSKMKNPVLYMKLEILSNHGHDEFTCIYRVRAHASPEKNKAEERR